MPIAGGVGVSLALTANGTVVAWGGSQFNQFNEGGIAVPAGLSNVIAIALAPSADHGLALKSDGHVVAWSFNFPGSGSVLAGLNNVIAVAAGDYYNMALRSDGTVVMWSGSAYVSTTVPAAANHVVAIAAEETQALALRSDGTVVRWENGYVKEVPGLSDIVALAGNDFPYSTLALKADGTVVAVALDRLIKPINPIIQPHTVLGLHDVVAIAADGNHYLALRADGTVACWGDNQVGQSTFPTDLSQVVAWGDNQDGQCTVPTGLNDVVSIAAAADHSLALRANGTVVGWGDNQNGQNTAPVGLSNVVAIAAGDNHSLALKANGNVIAWGADDYGQCNVPTSLNHVVAIAAGLYHSLALKDDGTVVAWGDTGQSAPSNYGQGTVPSGLGYVIGIAAAGCQSLALVVNPVAPRLQVRHSDSQLILSWPAISQGFRVQTTLNPLDPTSWQTIILNPSLVDSQYILSVPIEKGLRFFRLGHP